MRPEGPPPGPTEAGFTLLETLVALAVLGVILVTLFRIAGDSLVQHESREARLRLALTAEAALKAAQLGADGLPREALPADLEVSLERQALDTVAPADLELPAAAVTADLDWLSVVVVDAADRRFTLGAVVPRRR